MQSPPISRTPPEIIYNIIAWNSDDSKTLTACSLTCRAWTTISQSFLFREIRLGSMMFAKTSHGFFDVLDSNPSIGTYARILHISWDDRSGAGGVDPVIQRLTNRLPNVQMLRILSVTIVPENLGQLLATALPALRVLEFSGNGFSTLPVVGMILANPKIESFSLGELGVEASRRVYSTNFGIHVAGSPRLKEIFCFDYLDILLKLFSVGAAVSVHSVHISTYCRGTILMDVLRGLGNGPEILTLHAQSWSSDIGDLTLASGMCLRKLDIGDFEPRSGSDRASNHLLATLSSVAFPSLEEIVIHLHCRHVYDLKAVDWASLSRILREGPFANLRQLMLYLVGPICDDICNATTKMKNFMSDFPDNGLLTIKVRTRHFHHWFHPPSCKSFSAKSEIL